MILGQFVHTGDCMTQFIPNLFYGVAIRQSYRLLHLGEVALLSESRDIKVVWRHRIGSSNYPQNAVWQMALRCFKKMPL